MYASNAAPMLGLGWEIVQPQNQLHILQLFRVSDLPNALLASNAKVIFLRQI